MTTYIKSKAKIRQVKKTYLHLSVTVYNLSEAAISKLYLIVKEIIMQNFNPYGDSNELSRKGYRKVSLNLLKSV